MSTPAEGYTVRVGLRSGKVMTVKVAPNRSCEADLGGLTLNEIAFAAAGVNIHANQLYRPTTVAERAVTLSHLFSDTVQQQQAMLLPAADVLVGNQVGPGCRRAVLAAIFDKLGVWTAGIEATMLVDSQLTVEEILLLQPARGVLIPKPADGPMPVSGLTPQQLAIVRSRVDRQPPKTMHDAVDEYLKRWSDILVEQRVRADTQNAMQSALNASGFWPHRIKTTVADISNAYRVPFAKVASEVELLVKNGTLVATGDYYHVVTGSGA